MSALIDKAKQKNELPDLIDVNEIIGKIEIPQQFEKIYEKFVLFGMRLMFSRNTINHFTLAQLKQSNPLPENIGQGIAKLVFYMAERFNYAVPAIVIIPAAMALCLKGYDFLQLSHYPGLNKQVLGASIESTIAEVLRATGKKVEDIPDLIKDILLKVEQGVQDA